MPDRAAGRGWDRIHASQEANAASSRTFPWCDRAVRHFAAQTAPKPFSSSKGAASLALTSSSNCYSFFSRSADRPIRGMFPVLGATVKAPGVQLRDKVPAGRSRLNASATGMTSAQAPASSEEGDSIRPPHQPDAAHRMQGRHHMPNCWFFVSGPEKLPIGGHENAH
jgi:hypothetical protein